MEFLSEDPTYLAGGLGLIAGGFLLALKLTQQGKHLIRALIALGLALAALGVEWVWVTDNERIEAVVYQLGKAVEASDAPRALALMTKDVQLVRGSSPTPSLLTRTMIQSSLENAKFDFLRITNLKTNAGAQSRRGTAEFRVLASGSYQAFNSLNFGSHNSSWSLGFKETSPGVWRVTRITPVNLPYGQLVFSGGEGVGRRGPDPALPPDMDPGLRAPSRKASRIRGRMP